MVRDKARPPVLLGHAGVVALASWAALGFAPVPLLLLLSPRATSLIDGLKVRAAAARASRPSPPTRPPISR